MSDRALEMRIDSRLEDVSLLGVAVRAVAVEAGLTEADAFNVELCVAEGVQNSIRHAYRGEAGHEVVLRLQARDGALEIEILDHGSPVPDDKKIPRDPDLGLDERDTIPEGGRGVFLMTSLMDVVEFGRDGATNRLRLMKKVAAAPEGGR